MCPVRLVCSQRWRPAPQWAEHSSASRSAADDTDGPRAKDKNTDIACSSCKGNSERVEISARSP
jgi:hypothetical protein